LQHKTVAQFSIYDGRENRSNGNQEKGSEEKGYEEKALRTCTSLKGKLGDAKASL
jgi:hypothetical protein